VRLLTSVETFAVRRVLRPLAGWMIGLGAYYLLIGLTAVSVTDFLRDNPALAGRATQAGFETLGSITGFAATLFAILALPVGAFTAVRMSSFIAAETDRRLTLLASAPVSRARLIGAEITATAAAAAVLVIGAALATSAGVTVMGGELAAGPALRGVWNIFPIVLLSLGAAVFAAGWVPRWAGLLGALPATGGFLLLVIAESVAAPSWVRDISPFAHLAPVPLTGPHVTASAALLIAAALLTGAGIAGYRRRDLRT
jgi:ABC-2 type transport system permease protein